MRSRTGVVLSDDLKPEDDSIPSVHSGSSRDSRGVHIMQAAHLARPAQVGYAEQPSDSRPLEPAQEDTSGSHWNFFLHEKLPRLRKHMSRYPSVVGARIKESFGYKIRKILYAIDGFLGPWVKRLVPNFIVAHYIYVTFMAFLGSILIYPQHNIRYIDALFFGSGAASQAGLNTVDVNRLTLFQQLSIYLICMMTTPIFIHTMVVFARIYWFEKSMDDIKEKSAKDFRMRRTATLAAIRTMTMDNARNNSIVDQERVDGGYNTHNSQQELDSRLQNSKNGGYKDNLENNQQDVNNVVDGGVSGDDDIELQDLPSPSQSHSSGDDEENRKSKTSILEPGEVSNYHPNNVSHNLPNAKDRDIQFAELPHPTKKETRSRDIDPRDLYMSISMMQHRSHQKNTDVESGPALHINGPAERESLRLPGHHHRHRRYRRQRRNQRLKLLRQQAQRDYLVRDELNEIKEEEDGGSPKDIKGNGKELQFKGGPISRWRRHLSRGAPQNITKSSPSEALSGIQKVPGDAISDDNYSANDDANHSSARSAIIAANDKRRLSDNSPTTDGRFGRRESSGFLPKLSRRFTRTFTGRQSSSPANSNPSDMSDDELISLYSRNGVLNRTNYLSWNPTIGRNSTFVAQTNSQREELGGVEYRSLKLLSIILVVYYVGFHAIALCFFMGLIFTQDRYHEIVNNDGVSATWWAFFTSQTCFNNLGYTLTPDSMIPFNKSPYVLIIGSFFIVIGNTGFPIFLRFIIWIMFKLSKPLTMYHESLAFLLDHPRRCFTLLFPSGPTYWLLAVLLILNAVDLILFVALDLDNVTLRDIPKGDRVLDGLFQAFSTRTAGLAVVNIGTLHSAIEVSYMIMMYISVLPLAMSIRRTNVYEEQSLGVYIDDEDENQTKSRRKSIGSFVGMHLKRQLYFDLWFVFLGLFIICVCENKKLQSGDYYFQVFQILFETVSAYGGVGLSLGYPDYTPSFSGRFSTLSKLVIIIMMLRGRQRGLPYSIDRAVVLNSDKLKHRDELQAYHTMRRTRTMSSGISPSIPATRTRSNISEAVENIRENGVSWRKLATNTLRAGTRMFRAIMMGPGGDVDESRTFTSVTNPNRQIHGEQAEPDNDSAASEEAASEEASSANSTESDTSHLIDSLHYTNSGGSDYSGSSYSDDQSSIHLNTESSEGSRARRGSGSS
ncbi:hypothetical protein FOA43_004187 [Brettanomyces nanus]|uniref:Potassium transport protein n=1 Tax=Eeniella nana TaxID=13502 RepID=A0A875S799_EENNA|nr:uncharacterized protein FOA43_004187 [Brettanomyces nanus]QPG76793.1 hypothetical protein FOA43_004187 [Brettanomyces nanus]